MLKFSLNNCRPAGRSNFSGATIACSLSFFFLISVVAVYYLFLLSSGDFQIFAPENLDQAFNNMLLHLLHGEFTVDRGAIGYEAFTRDGKTYAYFGIFPAVLRLLAIPVTNLAQAHLARLSCLTATVIFIALQLRMLLIVHSSLPAASRRPEFLAVMMTATVLSGPQLYLLGVAWIYHEPILWSAAMGAAFNLIIVRRTFIGKSLRSQDLILLALLAGLAINTRPSIGVALYLGTMLLVLWTVWYRYTRIYTAQQLLSKGGWLLSTILPSIAILSLGAVVVGIVNFERWGNAFTFADFRYWDMRVNVFPNLIEIIHNYGEFGLGRIWIGALYYSTDIPYLLKVIPPFAEFLRARVVELDSPPSTPVLTNPLTIILAGIGLYRVWWKPELSTQSVAVLRLSLLAHASTVVLILAAMAFSLRYRFDFAPFMSLAALVGYGSVSRAMTEACQAWQKRMRMAAIGLCFLGVLFSHYELLLYKIYCWVVPINVRLSLLPFAPFARYVFHR
ncbi:MAG: hypothetical protein JO266_08035 [Acidobacteria bacterium]|nr:hypothetical protein [Acidobacteriota bacterium]MBV9483745.1 hypothetical protein [Acidobacteriota bacterium]